MVNEVEVAGRGRVWWTFRVFVTALTVDAYLQAVLAGRFLSGDYGMLLAHRVNAVEGVAILSLMVVAAAVLAWRKHRAPGVLVLLTVALSAAVVGQIATGFNRILGVHIPLGVAVIVLCTVLTVWAWRRAA
jgi:hypothetical protein